MARDSLKKVRADLTPRIEALEAMLKDGPSDVGAEVADLRQDLEKVEDALAALARIVDEISEAEEPTEEPTEEPEDDPPAEEPEEDDSEEEEPEEEPEEDEEDDEPSPPPPPPQTGDNPFGTTRLTFSEDFRALDFAKWKPRFDFGNQSTADSLRYAHDTQPWCAVDPRVASDRNPFEITPSGLKIKLFKNPNPSDPRFLAYGKPSTWLGGVLTTSPSFQQLYGYFEAVMTLPTAQGAFPAFWLLNGAYDEIDVMEWLGANDRCFFNAHKPSTGEHAPLKWLDGLSAGPHAYGVRWTANEIIWYVDRIERHRSATPKLNRPMHMIVNHVCGGWDGNDQGIQPSEVIVHSVKAWA